MKRADSAAVHPGLKLVAEFEERVDPGILERTGGAMRGNMMTGWSWDSELPMGPMLIEPGLLSPTARDDGRDFAYWFVPDAEMGRLAWVLVGTWDNPAATTMTERWR